MEHNSPILEIIEVLVEDFIIPLIGGQLVVLVEGCEGIDQMGAQVGVNVSRQVSASTRSVLGPVGEVAQQGFGGGGGRQIRDHGCAYWWIDSCECGRGI